MVGDQGDKFQNFFIMKSLLNFLFLVFIFNNSIAQSSTNKSTADSTEGVEAILMLKEGTLIVRLYSFKEKIEHLEATKGKEIADLEKERIEYANKAIIQEFTEDYNFSKVVYTYGTELDQFLRNEKVDVFLNNDLEFDTNIQIHGGPIFILASRSSTNFRLYDINFSPIENPSIKYVSHHLDSKFQDGLAEMTQGFREILTSRVTAEKLNKRLTSIAKAN